MSAQKSEIIEAGKRDMESKEEVGLNFTDEEIETIRNTVAKNANEEELKMFLSLCKRYKLDPFAKEIFFWKINGRSTIMTSRDGYLKIADRHPQYDGIVSDVVKEQDNFRRKSDGIDHEYSTDRGNIIGAYALVYRKDRKYPIYVFAPFDEYNADSRVWKQYPSAMILKVAESMALKRAFTISGLVSREEMEVTRLQEDSSKTKENSPSSSAISEVEVAEPKNKENASNKDNSSNKINDKKNENNEGLSRREKEINEMISENLEVKDELKKELFSYLSHIKEKNELEKISLNDLSDDEFDELKNILIQIKSLLEKSA